MKLVSFSVENYRSITNARKIALSDYSILVGANNEGKSNILHALALGMNALSAWSRAVRRTADGRILRSYRDSLYSDSRQLDYRWETDFPVSKQNSTKKDLCTRITLEFLLSDKERIAFKSEIDSVLNDTLPILIAFYRDRFDISVQKPGRGHATLNKKSSRIALFVSQRIRFNYIPAIRTSDSASRIIGRLVALQLQPILQDPKWQQAVATIDELQRPILEELGKNIKANICNFLPNVKSVDLLPRSARALEAIRADVEIFVDDGTRTALARKGDGVQSLAALALMSPTEQEKRENVSRIIAIEEPESHLHPRAIHELRIAIEKLAVDNQIVLTSHSPLFVRVNKLNNTVIVKDSRAIAANSVSEIREALGVRFSDNLENARMMIVMEGSDDVQAVSSIVKRRHAKIASALEQGILAFDYLGGASSLNQKASYYKASACEIACFLDDDLAGRAAVKRALETKAVELFEVTLCACGSGEAELEDLYDVSVYKADFFAKFGVDAVTPDVHPAETRVGD